MFRHWLRSKHFSRVELIFLGTLLAGAAYFPIFIFSAVEARYSLPEYALLVPFFVYGGWRICGIIVSRDWQRIGITGSSLGICVASSVLLSQWITAQAPILRELDMATVHGKLGNRMQLLGYKLTPQQDVKGGTELQLTLAWSCAGGPVDQNELRVDLEDQNGRVWSQGRHDVGLNSCPSTDFEEVFGGRFSFQLPATMPGGVYEADLGLYDQHNQEYIPAFDLSGGLLGDHLKLTDLPIAKDKSSITASQLPIENPYFVDMHEIRLLGYTQIPIQLDAGSVLDVGLYWRARSKPQGDYVVLVQLRNSAGDNVFVQSARPADGTYPTTLWDTGEVLLDWHTFQVPQSIPPGAYGLFAALRDSNSNEMIGEARIAEISLNP